MAPTTPTRAESNPAHFEDVKSHLNEPLEKIVPPERPRTSKEEMYKVPGQKTKDGSLQNQSSMKN